MQMELEHLSAQRQKEQSQQYLLRRRDSAPCQEREALETELSFERERRDPVTECTETCLIRTLKQDMLHHVATRFVGMHACNVLYRMAMEMCMAMCLCQGPCVCLCVCVCVHVCGCACVFEARASVHARVCVPLSLCVCLCMCIYVYIIKYSILHICTHV